MYSARAGEAAKEGQIHFLSPILRGVDKFWASEELKTTD